LEKIILYDKFFEEYLTDLIDILFYKDYFSYIENAENYVVALKNEIENYIDVKQHYQTPKNLTRYGNLYIIVSPNYRTS